MSGIDFCRLRWAKTRFQGSLPQIAQWLAYSFHSHLASAVCRDIDNHDPSKYPERQQGVLKWVVHWAAGAIDPLAGARGTKQGVVHFPRQTPSARCHQRKIRSGNRLNGFRLSPQPACTRLKPCVNKTSLAASIASVGSDWEAGPGISRYRSGVLW